MKAEISHHGFTGEKSYSGVYLQQGTMITDRDWNALCDRLKARLDNIARPMAASGAPKHGGLLTAFVEVDPAQHVWSANFAAKGGWIVAAGVAAEAKPANAANAFSYTNQRDLPGLSALPAKTFLYADIWDQVVTAFDDRDLLDPGLHGAHTCFVTRTLVQIKRYKEQHGEETECGLRLNPLKMPSKGTGRFKIALRQISAGPDNCDPCADTVDVSQNVGNFLFRLEVHNVTYNADGVPQTVTLKWSEDNGAVQYDRPADFDHSKLDPGYAYEFFNASLETFAGIPPLGYAVNPVPLRGDLRHSSLSGAGATLDRIRQWDGYCTLNLAGGTFVDGWERGVALASGLGVDAHGRVAKNGQAFVINLETLQLEITLTGNDADGQPIAVLAGDYWLALARTRAADPDKVRALSETPIGIQHHYCVLGACDADGKSFKEIKSADKRRLGFPALTCLQAGDIGFQQTCNSSLFKGENPQSVEDALKLLCNIQANDVGYDNSKCAYAKSQNAANVQDALDAFCKRLQAPYLVLRMSQGTGQESSPRKLLPCRISVVVEDQDGHPAKGVAVTFSVKHSAKDQVFKDAASANPAANQKELKVESDEEGQAGVVWWVDGDPGCHGLKVTLDDAPQKIAPPLWFAAEVTTTAGNLPKLDGVSWKHDQTMTLTEFIGSGLGVKFTEAMRTASISSDNFIVTVERPDEDASRQDMTGYRSVIVLGQFTVLSTKQIQFKPAWNSGAAALWLRAALDMAKSWKPDWPGLRCRVRLLGRFVFDDDGKRMTDAFVPGVPGDGNKIELDFKNAGLGEPSDFESWFYLVPDETVRPVISINTATLAELTALPGIDQNMANKIISGRPWTNVDDLVGRAGVPAASLNTLKPLIKV